MLSKIAISCLLVLQVEGFVQVPSISTCSTSNKQNQQLHSSTNNRHAAAIFQRAACFQGSYKSWLLLAHQNYDTIKNKGKYPDQSKSQEIEKTIVILYHKPKGVITSHSNQDSVKQLASASSDNEHEEQEVSRQTVYEDIMSMKGYISSSSSNTSNDKNSSFGKVTGIRSKLHAIGRLDADTTGLLLLTNDGALVHHVTNPTASSNQGTGKIVKVYDALIMGHHTLDLKLNKMDDPKSLQSQSQSQSQSPDGLRRILNGVDIGKKYGGMTLPPHYLKVLDHPSPKSTLVRIAISEGRNRQVRRMFHAINSGVMQLHRRQVGDIDLDMLKLKNEEGCEGTGAEGSWRLLTEKEILHGLGWKVKQLEPSYGKKDQPPSVRGKKKTIRNKKKNTNSSKRR